MAGLRIVAFSFHYYSQRYPLRLISSVKALPPIKCAPPAAGLVVEKFRYHYQAHLSSFETSVSVYESRIQFGFCCSRTRDGGRWKEKSFIIHLSRLHPRTVDKEEKEWLYTPIASQPESAGRCCCCCCCSGCITRESSAELRR